MSKRFRFIFKLFGILFAVFYLVSCSRQKPNIILFLVDDLGWRDVSFAGSTFYETPNIDKLASEGSVFTNSYAAHPRCVPSRYAIMTGKFPARANIPANTETMDSSEVTIAEVLKDNGYTTFFAGKWHLGKKESEWPQNQGFDFNAGGCSAGAPISYFFPYNEKKYLSSHNAKRIIGLENGIEGEYLTDRLTKETIKFINENSNLPFFACVAHYAVHTPLEAKQELINKYDKKLAGMTFKGDEFTFGPDGRQKMHQNNPTYAAMVESMDESLGSIIRTLKEKGLYDNTIIIFTSDHGGLSNSGINNRRKLATTNLPLRAGKGHIYEGGIKIPTIVRWNGHTVSGSTIDEVITGTDYYPTILEMAGIPLKPELHKDGISFVPAIHEKKINEQREFFWHSPKARPASTGDHNCTVIRKGNFKMFHFYDSDSLELYDLAKDPNEKNNLANSLPLNKDELYNYILNWKNEIVAPDQEKD